MSPLDGSTLIYKTFVLPFFYKNQGAIDNVLNRGKAAFSNLADEGSSLKHNSWTLFFYSRKVQLQISSHYNLLLVLNYDRLQDRLLTIILFQPVITWAFQTTRNATIGH